jgi:hypothetical protein
MAPDPGGEQGAAARKPGSNPRRRRTESATEAPPAGDIAPLFDGAVIRVHSAFVELPPEAFRQVPLASRVLSFAAQLLSCAAPTHSVLVRERPVAALSAGDIAPLFDLR